MALPRGSSRRATLAPALALSLAALALSLAALALAGCGDVGREPLAIDYEPGVVHDLDELPQLAARKRLRGPGPVVRDDVSNVVVLDRRRRVVRVFGPTGTPIVTLDGSDSTGGRFRRPVAVAADSTGALYVIDAGRRHIVTYAAPTG